MQIVVDDSTLEEVRTRFADRYSPEAVRWASPPPRVLLQNLATGEEMRAPLNPNKLPFQVSPQWQRELPQGHTSEIAHYKGTLGIPIPLEFVLFQEVLEARPGQDFVPALLEYERFFLSLGYPVGSAGTIAEAAPPRVLVVWPSVMALPCKVASIKFEHERFSNVNLRPLAARVAVDFFSVADERITSEHVRDVGLYW